MRVKLSYTVDEEDVLAEGAKLINLCGDDMQQCIHLFKSIQDELKPTGEIDGGCGAAPAVNTPKALDMVEEFRRALFNVDLRLSEVGEIIKGYSDYKDHERPEGPSIPTAPPVSPSHEEQ